MIANLTTPAETTAPLASSIAAEPFVLPAAITAAAAAEFGFTAITTGFSRAERPLLESLIAGLRGKPFRLVSVASGLEVWRISSEVFTIAAPSVVSLIKIHAGGTE